MRVAPRPIVANDNDFTSTPIQQRNGGATASVLVDDTLDGIPVDSPDVTVVITDGAGSGATISGSGVISVPQGSPAGTHTITYQICEVAVPSNCDTATATFTVVATTLTINDDDFSSSPVPNTGGTAGNVFDNDQIGSDDADSGNAIVSVTNNGGLTGVTINNNGDVIVPGGSTPGAYTVEYTVCEAAVPSNCTTAEVVVVVAETPITATNDTYTNVNGNTGESNVGNVLSNDNFNGDSIDLEDVDFTVTSALPAGVTVSPSGDVSVAPGTAQGDYTIMYQICEAARPSNCDTATVQLQVRDLPGVVVATDESLGPVVDGPAGNVLANDTINGSPAGSSNATATVTDDGGLTGVTIGSDGTLVVPANTPAGSYEVEYDVCESLHPTNCQSATATVTVAEKPLVLTSDSIGPIDGRDGRSNAGNVLTGDTLGGDPIDPSDVTITTVGTLPSGITLDFATGEISVEPGTPAGNYTLQYQVCENLNPTNCDTSSVEIVVSAAPIDAGGSSTPPPVAEGPAGNVFDNGSLGGDPIDPSDVTVTVTDDDSLTGVTINENGDVIVPVDTPAGSYEVEYQVCENLNPTNCDTSTIIIQVLPPVVDAHNDSFSPVNSQGGGRVGNVVSNDTINGNSVTAGRTVITAVGSLPSGITLDTTTGDVYVAPGTPEGTYTFEYQICHAANPSECSTATVQIVVTQDDVLVSQPAEQKTVGSNGGPITNVYDNTILNNERVNPDEVTVRITDTAGINGIEIAEDGTIMIPSGVAPGTYTITYEVCLRSSPDVCTQNSVTFTVEDRYIPYPGAPNTGFETVAGYIVSSVGVLLAGVVLITVGIVGVRHIQFNRR